MRSKENRNLLSQDVMLFLNTLLQQTRAVLEMRRKFLSVLREPFEKYLVLHLKILTDLLEGHPFSFLHTMKPALELICSLCFSQESAGLLFQRFTIFSLNIIKQVLLCMEYRTPKDLDDVKDPRILEGSNMKREFFTDTTVIEICGRLVSDYLPLSRDELELWDSDPEEYMIDDSVSCRMLMRNKGNTHWCVSFFQGRQLEVQLPAVHRDRLPRHLPRAQGSPLEASRGAGEG